MQRILFICLIFVCFSFSPASAQKILLGPKAGANLSWIQFIDPQFNDRYRSLPVAGYDLGFALSFPVTKQFSLHTEVNLVNRGKNLKERQDSSFYHKAHYRHIEVPALFRFHFGPEHFRFYLNAGPSFSYWHSGKGKIQVAEMDEQAYFKQAYRVDFGPYVPGDEELTMYMTEVNRFQINLNFGAGMMMELVNGHYIMFDLRFRWGQTYLGESKSGQLSDLYIFKDNLFANSNSATFAVAYLAVLDFEGMLKGKSTIRAKRWRN